MKKKLTITIDDELYDKVFNESKDENRTVSQQISKILLDHFKEKPRP